MISQKTLQPYEIFEEIQFAESEEARVKIIQENQGYVLNTILNGNFKESVKFDLPEGPPPYQPDDSADPEASMSRMNTILQELPLLLVSDKRIDRLRKEVKFIGILESVNVKNAEVLIAMKDKALTQKYPALTRELCKKAVPGYQF